MQYLVEGARGPLPPSPEQAIALLEETVIPHFEHVTRLKAEGRRKDIGGRLAGWRPRIRVYH